MDQLLDYAIDRISQSGAKTETRLQEYARQAGPVWRERAEEFFERFERFLKTKGLTFDYGIECYLKLREAMAEERLNFIRSRQYSNTSFAQVAEDVYHNPEVMQYHMYGLVLAQFLWPDQYHRYSFFCDKFQQYAPGVRNYLEIGGGHALYVSAAVAALGPEAHIDVVDISASSLELAKGMLPGAPVCWHHQDIFDFTGDRLYDFITIGEVLEHLEDPVAMLRRIQQLLAPAGRVYITTPANAPMIDHIYLFHSADDIRQMFQGAGFQIESETSMFAEAMPPAKAEKLKVALMYAAFVHPF